MDPQSRLLRVKKLVSFLMLNFSPFKLFLTTQQAEKSQEAASTSETATNNSVQPASEESNTAIMNPAQSTAIRELPALRDAPPNKREELFRAKLQLCSVVFSFDDPTADKRGKDMKRQTLLELVDYVNTPAGQKIFTESVMADLMACVSANVCRALPPVTDDFDPEEDDHQYTLPIMHIIYMPQQEQFLESL